MFNYIKFAIYQVVSLTASVPKLNRVKKNADTLKDEAFKFVNSHASKSLKLVNINLTIKGRERIPSEPVLFVSNHASMLDSYILVSSVNRSIGVLIAKEPVWEKAPIVSDWLGLMNSVYIDRKNNREGLKAISEAANNIKNGISMGVFPEGDLTWVNDPNAYISEFRNGALKIAYKANCPIVPMVIKNSKGTYEGYEPIGKINSRDVEVEFLEPIYDHIHNPKLKSTLLGENIRQIMIDSMLQFESKNENENKKD